MDKFEGFPAQGFGFFRELAVNNNRKWFEAHKQDYLDYLQTPAVAFLVELGERLKSFVPGIAYDTRTNGAGSIMRIYRDIRFSKDKSPYKTHLGINWWEGSGKGSPGFHFFIDADGAAMHSGYHEFDKPMLDAFRQAAADDRTGRQFQQAISKLTKSGDYQVGGEQLKRVPPGYDPEHPRGDLLRYKGLWVRSPHLRPTELESRSLIDICLKHCRAMAPVHRWFVEVHQAA